MVAIDFPDAPSVDDTFTSGNKTWVWNGSVWNTVTTQVGATGPTGPQGGFDSTQTISDKSANYALLGTDAGTLITNSAAVTITVDDVLSVGEQVDFLQNGSDQITFAAGAGVTLNSKDGNLKTSAQYSPASVKCVASGVYVLVGDLGA